MIAVVRTYSVPRFMSSPAAYRSRFSLLFALLLLILSVHSSHSAANTLEGTVVKIADGDTMTRGLKPRKQDVP